MSAPYFKAETGQNYKAYLTRVWMERAMELVIGSNLKTYEITEWVVYNNVRHFVDDFRAAYQRAVGLLRATQKMILYKH